MKKETNKLKILLLEDMLTDVEIVKHELRKSNYDFELKHVDTGESYLKELNEFNPDIIISDYYLPNFDGLTALDLAKKTYPHTPFILITGTANEEIAVECMKRGADDYLIKKHLKRLNPAIKKALESKNTKELKHRAEEKYRSIFENATEGIFQTTPEGEIITINPAMARMLGYDSVEEQKKLIKNIGEQVYVNQQHRETLKELLRKNKSVTGFETQFYKKDRSKIWVSINIREVCDSKGNLLYYEGTNQDITARKKAEEENQLLLTFTKTIAEATDFDSALTSALKMVCECTAWEYGEVWIPDLNHKHLELSSAWFTKVQNTESFRKASTRFTFAPGIGLPGRVWKSKKPAWIPDVTVDDNFPRAHFAKEVGFKAGVGIPILAENNVVAVMSFFLTELRQEDERMISLISAIAEELGMLFQRKRIQEELLKKDKHHRAVIENIFKFVPEGLLVFSENFNLLKQNKAFEYIIQKYSTMLGYTREELTQKIVEQLRIKIPSSDTTEIHIPIKDSSRSILSPSDQFDELIIEFNHSRMFFAEEEEEEEEANIVISLKDVTERKKSEDKIRKLSNAVEQTVDIIVMTDVNGVIEYVNNSFETTTGYSKEEVIGKTPRILKSGKHNQKFYEELWATILSGEPFRGILVNKKKDGELYYEQKTITAVKNEEGKIINFVSTGKDITDQMKFQEELRLAKEKAEEANRLKSGFLATMSHEIRTPLNAILGYSGVLKDLFYDSSNEETKMYFSFIEEGSLRLLNTITQILDISKIEANEFPVNIKPISINKIIFNTNNLLNILAEKKNLKIALNLPTEEVIVNADEYCLNEIMSNVIHNAIKYSEQGTISINLRKTKTCGICIVKDEGIGISDEYQKHLFETFSQEDVTYKRPFEGTGLGLALTKRFVDLISGKIEVQSKKGEGTTVKIYIPLAQ